MDRPINEVLRHKGGHLQTIRSDATVEEAVRSMNHHHIGALLVVEAQWAVGIFTERDILQRVVAYGRDAKTTPVKEVMTGGVVVVTPRQTVRRAMRLMSRTRHRHLPVVDSGRLLGIVSIGDLTAWVTRELETEVRDLTGYVFGEAAAAQVARGSR